MKESTITYEDIIEISQMEEYKRPSNAPVPIQDRIANKDIRKAIWDLSHRGYGKRRIEKILREKDIVISRNYLSRHWHELEEEFGDAIS